MSQSDSDHSPSLIGRQLGDYRILSRLGRGGMAQVYLAEQRSLARLVALKVLKPDLAKDPSYILRFKNEARAAAALVHSNIVQIFEVGETEGLHYIAQEYVAGMNLSQYLRRHGGVSALMAVNVMTQIAAALKKAKALGVVHRDIKPENIMLSTEGEVKVADFGLARLTSGNQRSDLTQIGITMGTPLYMSPEQIEGWAVDHRADLYSFGVTCFHMLTGQPPFRGENPISIAIQHAKEAPPPIAAQRPDLPIALIQIVERLMAKRAEDRYQNAGEVLEALRDVQVDASPDNWESLLRNLQHSGDLHSQSYSLSQTQSVATRRLDQLMHGPRPEERWRRAALMTTALFLLPLLVGVGWAWWSAPPSLAEVIQATPSDIPRKPTIFDQYRYAFFQKSEGAWKSVIHYYDAQPKNSDVLGQVYVRFAKERLAEFYLSKGLWQPAEQIYNEFKINSPQGDRSRLVGEYGYAVARYRQGDPSAARTLLPDSISDPTQPGPLPSGLTEHWTAVREELAQ